MSLSALRGPVIIGSVQDLKAAHSTALLQLCSSPTQPITAPTWKLLSAHHLLVKLKACIAER